MLSWDPRMSQLRELPGSSQFKRQGQLWVHAQPSTQLVTRQLPSVRLRPAIILQQHRAALYASPCVSAPQFSSWSVFSLSSRSKVTSACLLW